MLLGKKSTLRAVLLFIVVEVAVSKKYCCLLREAGHPTAAWHVLGHLWATAMAAYAANQLAIC